MRKEFILMAAFVAIGGCSTVTVLGGGVDSVDSSCKIGVADERALKVTPAKFTPSLDVALKVRICKETSRAAHIRLLRIDRSGAQGLGQPCPWGGAYFSAEVLVDIDGQDSQRLTSEAVSCGQTVRAIWGNGIDDLFSSIANQVSGI